MNSLNKSMQGDLATMSDAYAPACEMAAMRVHRLSRATAFGKRGVCSPNALQSGVGLIEVLIAVLVLSIAFIGIAALQAMSLSTNNSAMARSMATIASYSILDAMRADMSNAATGSYTMSTAIAANACPDAGGTLATQQINQWCNQLKNTLGGASTTTGKIVCTTVPGSAGTQTVDCTITITFDDSRAGVGGIGAQTVSTRAML